MNSITYRITGLMFLLVTSTVFLLTYLANWQMSNLFQDYLVGTYQNMEGRMLGHMGMPEHAFLESVHAALGWVGAAIVLIGLGASYALARSITVPLRRLSAGVREIERGNFAHKVVVTSKDEVEEVASAFNRMAAALEANNHMRKQFLADIVHELRTPLSIIHGNLEGMLDGVVETDKEQLASLLEETAHLNRLIGDLRDLSLAEAGQLTLERTPTEISQLVTRSVGMLKPLADEKGIRLETRLGPVPAVYIDAGRINQVLYNLLTNALRYTASGGTITVSTENVREGNKEWVKIAVKDSGQGIDEADLPYIFDHFYRADKSRTRKSGGSGIGLSIVKQLVEIQGGRVAVESTVGVGSCFYIYLPVENSEKRD